MVPCHIIQCLYLSSTNCCNAIVMGILRHVSNITMPPKNTNTIYALVKPISIHKKIILPVGFFYLSTLTSGTAEGLIK